MAAKKRTKKSDTPKPASRQPNTSDPSAAPAAELVVEADPKPNGQPIVGIGASAGGLDAFKRFFGAMPPDSGIAFVLIPHLDPARESLMVELLARHTTMPVVEAKEGVPVQANRLYILPPNKYMTIQGGMLRLTGPVERLSSQTSIDLFLRSLAKDQQERSICIIFSGTGSHGALGLRAVKAAGGMAMVQDPATAEYDRMPQSAIATGLADYVLPPEQMPKALVQYVRHTYVNGGTHFEAPEAADSLTQILTLLRVRSNFDFRAYRKKMLARRIERRLGLHHLLNFADYLSYLREHPEEIQLLVKDLFIGVTDFFRDEEAFEQLATQVIAPLVQSKEADDIIRVWVPGCATGEEAYSIAMIIREQLALANKMCRVQIFATDLDEQALKVARQGVYPESITADVSAERLARFFARPADHVYQVSKFLRESISFAVQNLISDAPFTKLDLISCRNLLIYLEPDIQQKLMSLFHFALRPGGCLFLGSSEGIGRHADLFEPLSKKWRIYRRIGPTRPVRVQFPIVLFGEGHDHSEYGIENPAVQPVNLAELTRRMLVQEYAPAAVLINHKHEVLYYSGRCGKYLEFPSGEPTHDVVRIAREGLRSKLRSAISRAERENKTVVLSGLRVSHNLTSLMVKVTVRPVSAFKSAESLVLITFEDEIQATGERSKNRRKTAGAAAAETTPPSVQAIDESVLQKLESELQSTRADLQSTIEETESANEELKASNEEVVSMNEELQSTNEELETNKEELQSLNEEVTTVNNQLQEKVEELETANNDMANLLRCTNIATVFLDAKLRVKLFTPATTSLFSFIASDIGRSIDQINPKFSDPHLLGDTQDVLQDLSPREREVSSSDGNWWLRRISPYRTTEDRIDGVVVTFVDITERKRAGDEVVRRLAAIVESSADAIFSKDLDGTVRTWNRGAERLHGYTAAEMVGRSARITVPEDQLAEWTNSLSRVAAGEHVEHLETVRVCKNGRRVPIIMTYSPLRGANGQVNGISAIARDITERKKAEEALRESEKRFRVMADAAPVLIWTSGTDKLCTWFNKMWLEFTGRPMEKELGNGWVEGVHADDLDHCLKTYTAAFDARRPFFMEYRLKRHDGEYRWLLDNGVPRYEASGQFEGFIGSCIDISERRQAEESAVAAYRRLQLAMSAARMAAWTWDPHKDVASSTENFSEIYGLANVDSFEHGLGLVHPEDRSCHREIVENAVKNGTPYHSLFRIVRPDNGQVVWLDERAVPVTDTKGRVTALSGIAIDISERKQAEQEIREREERLQNILDTAADAIITIDRHGMIQSVNAATERMFGYAAVEMVGQNVKMLMPTPYREAHDDYIAKYLSTRQKHVIGLSREVDALRKDGSVIPTDLAVSEIEHLGLFTGIHRDLTDRKRLEREVLEAASLEQRRIGQDLHDTVAQELTALSMLAKDLAETVQSDPAKAPKLAEQMAQGLKRSQRQLRSVLRGLVPVAVDRSGLMSALTDLAAQTQEENKLACVFDCPAPVAVADNLTATHLYLIAHEAVFNAVKHAQAHEIRIRLLSDGNLILSIQDDGVGMPVQLPEGRGLGLRIMRNRAAIIGAHLTIKPATPKGTVVTCVLPRSHHEHR
ncbi:MAG TPA: PAS domain S-box protein [Gemmataceae bacterium]|nr:PAS domain S-box protein [Gemmataceae bacterium]